MLLFVCLRLFSEMNDNIWLATCPSVVSCVMSPFPSREIIRYFALAGDLNFTSKKQLVNLNFPCL